MGKYIYRFLDSGHGHLWDLFFCLPQRVVSLDYCAPDFSTPNPKGQKLSTEKKIRINPQECGKVCNEERKKGERERRSKSIHKFWSHRVPDSTHYSSLSFRLSKFGVQFLSLATSRTLINSAVIYWVYIMESTVKNFPHTCIFLILITILQKILVFAF